MCQRHAVTLLRKSCFSSRDNGTKWNVGCVYNHRICWWRSILGFPRKKCSTTFATFQWSQSTQCCSLDNASFHHTDRVVSLIQSTGALVHFIPPDLNPIEGLRWTKAWDMSFLHYIHRYFKNQSCLWKSKRPDETWFVYIRSPKVHIGTMETVFVGMAINYH